MLASFQAQYGQLPGVKGRFAQAYRYVKENVEQPPAWTGLALPATMVLNVVDILAQSRATPMRLPKGSASARASLEAARGAEAGARQAHILLQPGRAVLPARQRPASGVRHMLPSARDLALKRSRATELRPLRFLCPGLVPAVQR